MPPNHFINVKCLLYKHVWFSPLSKKVRFSLHKLKNQAGFAQSCISSA